MDIRRLKPIIPFFATICVVGLFHFSKIYALKFYPVVINSIIFCIFFSSIFCEETIIQKFAKKLDGKLTDFSRNYTRKLTYIWCIFLFINLLISIATVFMSERVWSLYNACISYIALGIMFGVEYVIRIILRAKYDGRK